MEEKYGLSAEEVINNSYDTGKGIYLGNVTGDVDFHLFEDSSLVKSILDLNKNKDDKNTKQNDNLWYR